MAFKVVATPWGGRTDTDYPYEHEALRPLGITIATARADSDAEYVAQVKDADAIMVGGRTVPSRLLRFGAPAAQPGHSRPAQLHSVQQHETDRLFHQHWPGSNPRRGGPDPRTEREEARWCGSGRDGDRTD